ncbi:hypothetical protein GCM10018966_062660 [Streptomyces yanii]
MSAASERGREDSVLRSDLRSAEEAAERAFQDVDGAARETRLMLEAAVVALAGVAQSGPVEESRVLEEQAELAGGSYVLLVSSLDPQSSEEAERGRLHLVAVTRELVGATVGFEQLAGRLEPLLAAAGVAADAARPVTDRARVAVRSAFTSLEAAQTAGHTAPRLAAALAAIGRGLTRLLTAGPGARGIRATLNWADEARRRADEIRAEADALIRGQAAGNPDELVGETAAWALRHLHEYVDVGAMATQAGLSRRVFEQRFSALTGTTPLHWLFLQRIRKAQQILEAPVRAFSLEDIASLCGLRTTAALRELLRSGSRYDAYDLGGTGRIPLPPKERLSAQPQRGQIGSGAAPRAALPSRHQSGRPGTPDGSRGPQGSGNPQQGRPAPVGNGVFEQSAPDAQQGFSDEAGARIDGSGFGESSPTAAPPQQQSDFSGGGRRRPLLPESGGPRAELPDGSPQPRLSSWSDDDAQPPVRGSIGKAPDRLQDRGGTQDLAPVSRSLMQEERHAAREAPTRGQEGEVPSFPYEVGQQSAYKDPQPADAAERDPTGFDRPGPAPIAPYGLTDAGLPRRRATARGNGRQQPEAVPPTPGPRDERAPLYDALETNPFHLRAGDGGTDLQGSPRAAPKQPQPPVVPQGPADSSWRSSPYDDLYRQAERVRRPSEGGGATSGLPRRVPRANLVAGAAQQQQGSPQLSRAPDDVRGRLTNLRRGVQQGRMQQGGNQETDPDGQDLTQAREGSRGPGAPARPEISGPPSVLQPEMRAEPHAAVPAPAAGGLFEPRHLVAELAEQAAPDREVPLHVQITREPGEGGGSAPMRPIRLPPQGAQLTITVHAPGLRVLGDLQQQLTVYPGRDSEMLHFGLRTTVAGLHRVTVRAFRGGTYLGEVRCQISVAEGGVTRDGPRRFGRLPNMASDRGGGHSPSAPQRRGRLVQLSAPERNQLRTRAVPLPWRRPTPGRRADLRRTARRRPPCGTRSRRYGRRHRPPTEPPEKSRCAAVDVCRAGGHTAAVLGTGRPHHVNHRAR